MIKCSGERLLLARACRRVAATQEEVLRQTIWANRDTWFGRHHGFARIDGSRAFQERVMASTYDDYSPLVERIAAGESGVLTTAPVELLEPTSGTSSGEKLIPYTAGLRQQFQRGVAAWIGDLFYYRPAVRAGRAYWSISPSLGPPRRSPSGIPIGFHEDAAYLGRLEQFALRKLLVSLGPASNDLTDFRIATLRSLLVADDLALVSVWSPTFLTALLSLLASEESQARILTPLFADPHSGQRLQQIWRSSYSLPEKLRRTWPRLALVSCWTDAGASLFVPELRRHLPHIEIQPKGLLATEGFVSVPLVGLPAPALAVRCHFFEFEERDGGRFCLAHQLDRGGRYRVLITTAGGLYRYQLRDEVEVVGFHHQCPLLRFLGKCDLVSDLVGEKLAEAHVRSILGTMSSLAGGEWRFQLLVPVLGTPPRYRLYLQGPDGHANLEAIRSELQTGLEQNPYYRHAVLAGQLAPVEVELLDNRGPSAWSVYEQVCLERGRKCGDIKPAVLDPWLGWPERFAQASTPQ